MQAIVNESLSVCVSFVTVVFSSATTCPRMSQWFYAVGRGRQVGVYTTWAECQKQVEKIANARYKKFKTHKEAVAFIQECKENNSPHKSPSKTGFVRDSVIASTASVPIRTCSQSYSIFPQTIRPPAIMSTSQPSSSNSVITSQRINRPNLVLASTSREASSDVQKRLSPTTLSALQSLADEDPFTPEVQRNAPSSASERSMNGIGTTEFNRFMENVERNFTEIKVAFDNVFLKLNDIENRIQELSCQKATVNQNVGIQSASSGIKRSLLETYNIPQPVGNRSFSTNQTEEEVEIVPVPPKKIPKIELNSDDEVDGFAHDFRVNEEGYVIVYTDGACEKNGRSAAKAGIGVWFGDGHPLNVSEPVHGRATNNTAEIQAVVQALEVAKRAGVKRILVHTDSEFTINCITKWVHKWKKNNWKVASGADVKNKDDLILLLEAMSNIDVKWEHVRGHRGIHGNEMADRLARSGAERYQRIV